MATTKDNNLAIDRPSSEATDQLTHRAHPLAISGQF
jgi:hypothetical protein